ncbi:nucleoside-diphosphate-sugar epimerase [Weissella beninensis]|uniref:NAD-dependent epimerase/dehydratase family protein n=1 Tax=Periweissella beninensis TaxID=504936 RepID=A0ABT0VFB2_9LACO|nr:NAD-dependent epimerase/dehydratase family protein [Periweissella beninensis]MBM7543488.1 nucleoside-diphosphate-sugar epimerase [Periweissella beninensis]MCM2436470.1 NAD-dependent epimerase/dehydratase family protein [Periweissella beninensis]
MKIVIFGGSGFVGQGLTQHLAQDKNNEIIIISRYAHTHNISNTNIRWFISDISNDFKWHDAISEADWVIDCIGILLPNPLKKQNYYTASTRPAQIIVNYLASLKMQQPQFIFVSAKKIPWFMYGYAKSKLTIERDIRDKLLVSKTTIIYPTIIYDKSRSYSIWLANLIHLTRHIPWINQLTKDYQPINRSLLASQIATIMQKKASFLTTRSYNPYKELF